MSAGGSPFAKGLDYVRRAHGLYREETGQCLLPWIALAVLNFIAQIVFRREMAPGEFGTFNTVLGIIGLLTVPVMAFTQAFTWYLAQDHEPERREPIEFLRGHASLFTQVVALVWMAISFPLFFVLSTVLHLPRFTLGLFALLATVVALGGLVSEALLRQKGQPQRWAWLLTICALARLLLGGALLHWQPWAETCVAAFFVAGCLALVPALRLKEIDGSPLRQWRRLLDRDFLHYLAAAMSVLLGLFLFSSADRLVAQSWFGSPDNNIGYVNWRLFDAYQTAGLLGRALLWGAQPLLLVLFAQRSRVGHSTAASLAFLWIYLGVLLTGAVLLTLLREPLARLFCGGDFTITTYLIPPFALAMAMLGVLQAVGIFALASRRFPECFTFGGCGIAYAALLYLAGRQPGLMVAYMFGGGMMTLMVVLFVGVVRWGRRQP